MRLHALPDWLRAWGLPVVLDQGWQYRGPDLPGPPRVVLG